ncbi:uncharacterized protein BT62DRAFT_928718 [Guyanagaster necrorhizus]|uniref:Uncharacterized protein n=1 Tax=Guyanagaster necrorhizus TaxID=856835 RepID=A0A9P8AVU6_9AGAR|nr:uncharacterized protein BT62DRAFT_928718 [Guyanagaster necrorhizus MCA 3950]KAG7449944.1 hypothetical protein BT62DRAFT_928718 [Guyanagaster necrorhizus MCA 3950]
MFSPRHSYFSEYIGSILVLSRVTRCIAFDRYQMQRPFQRSSAEQWQWNVRYRC